MNLQSFCSKCGGQLIQQNENTYKCKFCDSIYHEDTIKKEIDALSFLLDEEKREKVSNLKRALWEKANQTYLDSKEIIRICQAIKQYVPDDFYANFYEAANSEIEESLVNELECMDVIEHYDDIEHILNYCLKSITPRNMLAICNLIERAYKQNDLSLYNEFRTKYDEQCALVNDCVYDPAYPRDVFVCYSSKDMAKVESLVKYLEEQGLICFVAIRNLQHGRGAVQNYWNAIHTAIENCKCVVFLSSTNSRDMHCDALQELRYVLSLEQKYKKKIKKIEYLLENYTGVPVERNFKRVFEGLEYCYDEETVYDRIMWDDEEETPVVEAPEIAVQKESKFCCNCGKENPDNAKFCFDCGKDVFVATQMEYIEYLKKEKAELERRHETLVNAQTSVAEQEKARSDVEENHSASRDKTHSTKAEEPDYFSGTLEFEDVDVEPVADYHKENVLQGRRGEVVTLYSGDEYMELIKGQNVLLPEGIKKTRVIVENEYKLDNVVADLYVFMLDSNEQVLSESDLVFFGNTVSLNKSLSYSEDGNKDVVDISFNKINQDIAKIRFIMSLNMEDGRIRNFSMVRSSHITILLEEQAFVINLTDLGRFESILAIEFYRIRNKWKLSIQVAGFKENISTLCSGYGIEVE
ncbi:MAG: TerD family protein [Clostridia bacterium]|nr:TerD family protein [Clostridia bacterium]